MVEGADLFCGAGGFTNGLVDALKELGYSEEEIALVCVNHWDVAIATHSINHPYAEHILSGVQDVNPWEVVPGRHLDILVAGPQCTYFSRARGGRPVTDQQRISPWLVVDWLEKLDVDNFIIENVPELVQWGPVDPKTQKPIKHKKGVTFKAFLKTLRSLNYNVDYRVLRAADYGDPTTRERLFIVGRKGRRVRWPEPTHVNPSSTNPHQNTLFHDERRHWVPARDIIRWDVPGKSIYKRKTPLAESTMRRIEAGLQKYSGLPFMLGQQSSAAPRSVEHPIPTVATAGKISLIQPYLVSMNGTRDDQIKKSVRSINEPVPTIVGSPHLYLATPFLVPYQNEFSGQNPRTHSIGEPLPTVVTENRLGLVQPYLVKVVHSGDQVRTYSVDEPIRTITSKNEFALVTPFLVQYNGTADTQSIDKPIGTLTTKIRFGLAQPMIVKIDEEEYMLDILFRMLLPEELAAAHSYPKSFEFRGTKTDVIKQIGNSVPNKMAKALCLAQLEYLRR